MMAGGLLAKAAVGLIGLAVVVGAVAPRPETDGRTRPKQGDRSPLANTITLEVPVGDPAAHLTVVDESGRVLAILTRWFDGRIGLVARNGGGAGVCCWLKAGAGTAHVNLFGTARQTVIDVQPDGTAKAFAGNLSGRLEPSGDPRRCGQGKERRLTDAARVARSHPERPD
jgi:hypothetical protein